MAELEWEIIQDRNRKHRGHTQRAKVFGGWLIKSLDVTCAVELPHRSRYGESEYTEGENISMAFIPDAMHVWDIADKVFKAI